MPELRDLDAGQIFDVVIVGAGPSGSSCAYWLAQAGWSVALVEKKRLPRAKTCGDGLTPRSVLQLRDMGLEDAVAVRGHRYDGLRAYGFGASVEMHWPSHETFPNYGYTITRLDLDGLVAEHAAAAGATLLTGVEVTGLLEAADAPDGGLRSASGVEVVDHDTGVTSTVRARFVVAADGQNSRLGRELGVARNRRWPLGMALRGYYRSARDQEPWIESHLDIRDPNGKVVPGYGWIFPLGDGRVNVGVGLLSTDGAWKGVNTTRLQEYFVAQVGAAWGLDEDSRLSAPTGGRLPMGLARGPRVGPNTLVVGDAGATINPFNGEGISYAYETGRLAAGVLGDALVAADPTRLRAYEDRLSEYYGEYYRVARAFVRLISDPTILAACVGVGMRMEPVMREVLTVMSNLMSNDRQGPAELAYRGLARLTAMLPDQVLDMLVGANRD